MKQDLNVARADHPEQLDGGPLLLLNLHPLLGELIIGHLLSLLGRYHSRISVVLPQSVINFFLENLCSHTLFHQFFNAGHISKRSVLKEIKKVLSLFCRVVLVWIKVDALVALEDCLLDALIFGEYQGHHLFNAKDRFLDTISVEKSEYLDGLNCILNGLA